MSQHESDFADNDATLAIKEVLSLWTLGELDLLHELTGIGPEWRASDRRAAIAAHVKPCGGANANVCVGEGCYGEACVTPPEADRP